MPGIQNYTCMPIFFLLHCVWLSKVTNTIVLTVTNEFDVLLQVNGSIRTTYGRDEIITLNEETKSIESLVVKKMYQSLVILTTLNQSTVYYI